MFARLLGIVLNPILRRRGKTMLIVWRRK